MKKIYLIMTLVCGMLMVSCKPEGVDGKHHGHEYVDLGLSVKWATCNLGASSSDDYGHYFAWGETTTKESYSEENCPTFELSYSQLQSQGYIDDKGNLTEEYDAATSNWGGDWRMPTYDELNELRKECTWIWTTSSGVNGYTIVGPNGSTIFLPAAGNRGMSSLSNDGKLGHYWSSTPDFSYDNSYSIRFTSGARNMCSDGRNSGKSIRPVME